MSDDTLRPLTARFKTTVTQRGTACPSATPLDGYVDEPATCIKCEYYREIFAYGLDAYYNTCVGSSGRVDYVTGEPHPVACSEKNTDGKCADFVAKQEDE